MCLLTVLSCVRLHARWDKNHGFIHGGNYANHRRSAFLAALTALVCTISLSTGLPTSAGASTASGGVKSLAIRAAAGEPPSNYVVGNGSYFSYPNTSSATAIRNRVLRTINSTWGKYTDPADGQMKRGKIYMTTWSFNDWGVRDALVEAAKRGATVRIIAAEGINRTENYQPWKSLKATINRLKRGNFSNPDPNNIARECSGFCRGGAGTPHSKFFLFDRVGSGRARHVVIQSSMNLTRFAFNGQWNQATVWRPAERLYNLFQLIHNQMATRQNRGGGAYVRRGVSGVTNIFYPRQCHA